MKGSEASGHPMASRFAYTTGLRQCPGSGGIEGHRRPRRQSSIVNLSLRNSCMKLDLRFRPHRVLQYVVLGALVALAAGRPAQVSAADEKALKPLPIIFPEPTLRGTPEDLPAGPTIEPPPKEDPAPFLAPEGVKNVAAGKPATSSVKPFTGEHAQLTDGKKEAFDSDALEKKRE